MLRLSRLTIGTCLTTPPIDALCCSSVCAPQLRHADQPRTCPLARSPPPNEAKSLSLPNLPEPARGPAARQRQRRCLSRGSSGLPDSRPPGEACCLCAHPLLRPSHNARHHSSPSSPLSTFPRQPCLVPAGAWSTSLSAARAFTSRGTRTTGPGISRLKKCTAFDEQPATADQTRQETQSYSGEGERSVEKAVSVCGRQRWTRTWLVKVTRTGPLTKLGPLPADLQCWPPKDEGHTGQRGTREDG